MIALLPLLLLGLPLALALVDLMATRSSMHGDDPFADLGDEVTTGRYSGARNELRRSDAAAPVSMSGLAYRDLSVTRDGHAVNVS